MLKLGKLGAAPLLWPRGLVSKRGEPIYRIRGISMGAIFHWSHRKKLKKKDIFTDPQVVINECSHIRWRHLETHGYFSLTLNTADIKWLVWKSWNSWQTDSNGHDFYCNVRFIWIHAIEDNAVEYIWRCHSSCLYSVMNCIFWGSNALSG